MTSTSLGQDQWALVLLQSLSSRSHVPKSFRNGYLFRSSGTFTPKPSDLNHANMCLRLATIVRISQPSQEYVAGICCPVTSAKRSLVSFGAYRKGTYLERPLPLRWV